MVIHQFGGSWTEDKLSCLHQYLIAYRNIFIKNKKARYFTTYYVDAFAGTGFRNQPYCDEQSESLSLFEDAEAEEIKSFFNGSVRIALEVPDPFDHYLFIDNNRNYVESLKSIKEEYPKLENKITIVEAEANSFLLNWCNKMDWKKNRAVVFLDPYGMQVDWKLIESLANTQAVDLWLLFPLGVAVNRCLTSGKMPPKCWEKLLTTTFGTDEWKSFYEQEENHTLFGLQKRMIKTATLDDITRFFVQRLETIFPGVVKEPLRLLNSKNNPIYILCFASANPRGSRIAVKIASDIIGKMNRIRYGRE
jgi:three-Cys-motif partner protein